MEAATQQFARARNTLARGGAIALIVVLTLLLIVVLVAYLVWRLNRTRMQSFMALKNPKRLDRSAPTVYASSKLPSRSSGQPFSVSFWLYLTGMTPTDSAKLVLWRQPGTPGTQPSPDGVSIAGANPIVFLDPKVNALYISVATTRNRPSSPNPQIQHLTDLLTTDPKVRWTHLTAKVDYVPLQRWVFYTATVQDNLLTVYQDGSLYTVATLFDMIALESEQPNPIFATVAGNMTIGNPTSSSCATPATGKTCIGDVDGFASRVQFFNYALTSRQVRQLYASGPTSTSMMRLIGASDYGVRSPVYRLDGEGDEEGR